MTEELSTAGTERSLFSISFRGYDKGEVDAYLAEMQERMRASQAQLEERAYEHLGEEMGRLLQHSRDAADQMIADANAQAQGIKAAAEGEATAIRAAAEKEAADKVAAAEKKVEELRETERQTRLRIKDLSGRLGEIHANLNKLGSAEAPAGLPASLVTDEEVPKVVRLEGAPDREGAGRLG